MIQPRETAGAISNKFLLKIIPEPTPQQWRKYKKNYMAGLV